jgi:DNA-binding protein H-NS
MKSHDLKLMPVDELLSLQELVKSVLIRRISAEKARLDQRLRQLLEPGTVPDKVKEMPHARRPYPPVFPKYKNPEQPAETWAGRGNQPRWLIAQLRSGKQLDEFRIQPPSNRARRRARQ